MRLFNWFVPMTVLFDVLDDLAVDALAFVVRMKFLTPRTGHFALRFPLTTASIPFPEMVRSALGFLGAFILFFLIKWHASTFCHVPSFIRAACLNFVVAEVNSTCLLNAEA